MRKIKMYEKSKKYNNNNAHIIKDVIEHISRMRKKGIRDWIILDFEGTEFDMDDDVWLSIWQPFRMIREPTEVGRKLEKPARINFVKWRIIPIFKKVIFKSNVNFSSSEFPSFTDFSVAVFEGKADFNASHFGESTTFKGAEFRNISIFRWAHFGFNSNFQRIKIFFRIDFESSSFEDKMSFYKAEIHPFLYIDECCQNYKVQLRPSKSISEVYKGLIEKYTEKLQFYLKSGTEHFVHINFSNIIAERGFDMDSIIIHNKWSKFVLFKDNNGKYRYGTIDDFIKKYRTKNKKFCCRVSDINIDFRNSYINSNFIIKVQVQKRGGETQETNTKEGSQDKYENCNYMNCDLENRLFIDVIDAIINHGVLEIDKSSKSTLLTRLTVVRNSIEGNFIIRPSMAPGDVFKFEKNKIHSSIYIEPYKGGKYGQY